MEPRQNSIQQKMNKIFFNLSYIQIIRVAAGTFTHFARCKPAIHAKTASQNKYFMSDISNKL